MIYWVFKRINFSFYIFCTYPVFPRCLYLNLSDDIFVFVRSVELIFVTWEDCAAGAEGGRSLSPFEGGFPDQIACKLLLWWWGLWLQFNKMLNLPWIGNQIVGLAVRGAGTVVPVAGADWHAGGDNHNHCEDYAKCRLRIKIQDSIHHLIVIIREYVKEIQHFLKMKKNQSFVKKPGNALWFLYFFLHFLKNNLPPLPELPEELQSALAEGSWVRNEERDVSWLRFIFF